jgi:hypothetical protein
MTTTMRNRPLEAARSARRSKSPAPRRTRMGRVTTISRSSSSATTSTSSTARTPPTWLGRTRARRSRARQSTHTVTTSTPDRRSCRPIPTRLARSPSATQTPKSAWSIRARGSIHSASREFLGRRREDFHQAAASRAARAALARNRMSNLDGSGRPVDLIRRLVAEAERGGDRAGLAPTGVHVSLLHGLTDGWPHPGRACDACRADDRFEPPQAIRAAIPLATSRSPRSRTSRYPLPRTRPVGLAGPTIAFVSGEPTAALAQGDRPASSRLARGGTP